jgi:type II secretory pathway component GspD/PulD (secretin)
MVSNRHHQYKGYWIFGIVAGLLVLLIPCTGAWSQGKGLQAQDTRQRSAAKGLDVVVQEGRLSVDLQEADLGEVLTQVGRQAGIRISSDPSSGKRVSARFAGVELEEGLRRLLRLASLSHIFLYANGPGGTVTISEVRVLGEGQDTTPRPATVVEPRLQENEQNAGAPVRKGRRQAPEVVEPVQESTPDPGQGEPSEVTRRVREVFKLSKEMKGKPADGQESSPHEAK